MVNKYPLIMGGIDVTAMVAADSYETTLVPVVGGSVTTMDGVTHESIIRECLKIVRSNGDRYGTTGIRFLEGSI